MGHEVFERGSQRHQVSTRMPGIVVSHVHRLNPARKLSDRNSA
jgi:hypothetical protein